MEEGCKISVSGVHLRFGLRVAKNVECRFSLASCIRKYNLLLTSIFKLYKQIFG